MFLVTGVTGNTGSVVANLLLAQGKSVTVLVRDAQKGESWQARGAQVSVGSLEDATALTGALSRVDGAYLMIPPNTRAENLLTDRARVSDAMAKAVQASGLSHAVLLSSIGAQHDAGTGPILTLHYAESVLGGVARNLTILRPAYFLENWALSAAGARSEGVLHNFLIPDRKIPMISTADVGAFAADSLLNPGHGRRVRELAGPEDYSPTGIAGAFASALGSPVRVETHPVEALAPLVISLGFSKDMARSLCEMYESINSGHVACEGAEVLRGKVTASEAIGRMF